MCHIFIYVYISRYIGICTYVSWFAGGGFSQFLSKACCHGLGFLVLGCHSTPRRGAHSIARSSVPVRSPGHGRSLWAGVMDQMGQRRFRPRRPEAGIIESGRIPVEL